jgi:hypothetical protein
VPGPTSRLKPVSHLTDIPPELQKECKMSSLLLDNCVLTPLRYTCIKPVLPALATCSCLLWLHAGFTSSAPCSVGWEAARA